MDSFLKETAQTLLQSKGDLKGVKVILPNRRAGLFFIKYLSHLVDRPLWMPEVITIEDLFYQLAEKRPADKLTLIYELYRVFQALTDRQESFDRFFFWGEMILKDFNDLDQFMVNPEKLFTNLKEQKVLESDWSFLSPEQVKLIREFWASFEGRDRAHQEKFLRFWDMLYPLYTGFNASLESLGLAYGGKIYRDVATDLEALTPMEEQLVFVGFNAFTTTEEKLIKYLVTHFGAKIFWDLDTYYLDRPEQEAGLFFRQYRKDPILGPTFPEHIPNHLQQHKAKINTYNVPLKINQANLVAGLLEQVKGDEDWEETVVILPEEQLLFPLLNVLPDKINRVNVTMGYPVRQTPVYTFLEAVLELQRYSKMEDGELQFYHKPVKDLLSNVFLTEIAPEFTQQVYDDLLRTNAIYFPAKDLRKGGEVFSLVFQLYTAETIMEQLLELIRTLAAPLEEKSMERTYLYQCFKQMNRLKEVFDKEIKEEVSVGFFTKLFRQVFAESRLPFQGEPLEGIQLMGVLETRNLDFKRVIICSMNEGSFPPSKSMDSLVPFNLRQAFGMPVQEQNDAIYAYTFYRLLHRAEEVHLIYSTAGSQGQVGEKSRYIHQLQIEMEHSGIQKEDTLVHVPVNLTKANPILIQKSPSILRVLQRYTDSPGDGQTATSFSPSALNMYLDCRLKFFLTYIAAVEVPDEVQEAVDPAIFGNLVHQSLENLYTGFIARKGRNWVEASDIEGLMDYISPAVEKAIRTQYFLDEDAGLKLTGQLTIARDVLQKYLAGVLEQDRYTTPFEIISLEGNKKYSTQLPVATRSGVRGVSLSGIIDRVDRVGATIRLIDYKSGNDKKDFKGISSLFDREDKSRNKAVMQTLFYGLLYEARHPDNKSPLKPALYSLRDIFQEPFSPYLQEVLGPGKKQEVHDFADYRDDFVGQLTQLLEEIVNPGQNFDQTDDLEKCRLCPFSEICSR
ncbi:PD-(D/E)XK nuclease family protein [Cyclobacterium jeungdonense]|uniref:Exodeoxyribonuclease V subunit gamma n=1 Tax=Cyclobacterium jeungdonense TaxID=708087 RepID=A0ABT8C908_9BACT|nr:PD-(D/E)XK nuclease family protein [Cyclobacterium jeungdonense]MDN3689239.1 exodeoxyribonuclease V subunit gamma [Cyclobacterium jeungdonense]